MIGPVQQDVGFLAVEQNLAGRRGDEHAQKGEGHGVQIDAQREDRLAAKGEGHQADQRVNAQRQRKFADDRLRSRCCAAIRARCARAETA